MGTVCNAAATRAALVLALALALAERATAQSPAPLTVGDVVRRVLAASPLIHQEELNRDASRGAMVAAAGLFDAAIGAFVSGSQSRDVLSGADAAASRTAASGYGVTLSKRLRTGITMAHDLTVAHSRSGAPLSPYSSHAALSLIVPLLQDRGGASSRAVERAAGARFDAAERSVQHTATEAVRDAVILYWAYVGAYQRLEVRRASVFRATRMMAEMQVLVDAGERPPADLIQLRANLMSKRIAQMSGEQDVIAARHQLGIAMALPPEEVGALPPPTSDVPAIDSLTPDNAEVANLVAGALANRADLKTVLDERRAVAIELAAASNERLGRIDLSGDVAFDGVRSPSLPASISDLLRRSQSGFKSRLVLQYERPLSNAASRGRALAAQAAEGSAELAEADLRRRIASAVLVAVNALMIQSRTAVESRAAASLYQTAVNNERRKYELGTGTIIEVLLSEDALTSAQLDEVDRRLAVMGAIAVLRFETATLVTRTASGPTANVDPPFLSR